MDKFIGIFSALEPVIVGAIGIGALLIVPMIVRAVQQKLTVDQQRFAYDVAKGIVKALDLIDDKTPTKIDDALLKVAKEVEQQLGRKLNLAEKNAVKTAVLASGRKLLIP